MTVKTSDIDLEAEYEVDLSKSYKLGSVTFSPRNKVSVQGSVLVEMRKAKAVLNERRL